MNFKRELHWLPGHLILMFTYKVTIYITVTFTNEVTFNVDLYNEARI